MAGGVRWAATLLLGVIAATAGCAGGTEQVRPANEWARAVCPALVAWREGVSEEDRSADPARARDTANQAHLSVEETLYEETARTGLLLRMASSHRLTEQALAAVRSAGLPAVADRRRLRDRLVGGLSGLADWYGQIERALIDLRTGNPAEYAAELEAIAKINPRDGVTPAGLLVWLDSQPQLIAAFAEVGECHPATPKP